jgi:hypothetical protein
LSLQQGNALGNGAGKTAVRELGFGLLIELFRWFDLTGSLRDVAKGEQSIGCQETRGGIVDEFLKHLLGVD